jgi:MFS transporter, DHA2 family, multidrug resistance protein
MSSFQAGMSGTLGDWEEAYRQNISPIVSRLSQFDRWVIYMSASLITAIEISNRVSINVLLPDMQGNVAANSDEISWVLVLYNLGFVCSLALSGWMSRLLGARRHLLIFILLYATGALGCLLSPHDLDRLLVARAIMGFGGGAFLVRTVTLVGVLFPGRARTLPVTWYYVLLIAFQTTYPVAMGAINDAFHWNYAFLLDFPFLIIGAALIWRFLPAGHLHLANIREKLDLWGAGLLIAGLVLLQIPLSRGERDLWFQAPWICVTLIGAAVSLGLFGWWESRPQNQRPVLHLRRVWGQQTLRASFSIVCIVGAIMGAALFVVPQYLRNVQDYSATQTGTFFSMYAVGLGIGLLLSLHLVTPQIGGRATLALGLGLLGATFMLFVYSWTPTTPGIVIGPMLSLQGFSVALTLSGVANTAVGQIALPELSDGETTYFFVRQLGNTLGVTAVAVIFDRRLTFHSSRLLDTANRLDPIVQSTLAQYAALIARNGGASSNPELGALQLFQNNVVIQTRLLSFIDISFCLAIICLLGLVVLATMRAKDHKDPIHLHVT